MLRPGLRNQLLRHRGLQPETIQEMPLSTRLVFFPSISI
jgi:hypothetical protein